MQNLPELPMELHERIFESALRCYLSRHQITAAECRSSANDIMEAFEKGVHTICVDSADDCTAAVIRDADGAVRYWGSVQDDGSFHMRAE